MVVLAGLTAGAGVDLRAGGDVLLLAGLTAGTGLDLQADGSVAVQAAVGAGSGNLVIQAGRGLGFGAAGQASAGGAIRLEAAGALRMDAQASATAGGGLALRAGGNATVSGLAAATAVAIRSGGAILDAGDVRVDIRAGSLVLQAQRDIGGFAAGAASALDLAVDSVSAVAQQGGIQLSDAGDLTVRGLDAGDDITLGVAGDITLGGLVTAPGIVRLTAAGAILDARPSALDIAAGSLVLRAGAAVGTPGDAIETAARRLTVVAGDGGIVLAEADSVTVGGLMVTGAGPLLVSAGGTLAVQGAATTGSGNVLLQATAGDISLQGSTGTGGGHLTVLAAGSLELGAGARLAATGTVDLEAGAGSIAMDAASRVSADGAMRLQASANVVLGTLVTQGNVAVGASTGSLAGAGVSGAHIAAAGAQLSAARGIGSAARPLVLDVDTLVARAGSRGIDLLEQDDVVIGDVRTVVQQAQADGSPAPSRRVRRAICPPPAAADPAADDGGQHTLTDGRPSPTAARSRPVAGATWRWWRALRSDVTLRAEW